MLLVQGAATVHAGHLAAQARSAPDERVEAALVTPLFVVPDSTTLATLQPGAAARVVGRRGSWVRLQLEGWAREADMRPAANGPMAGVGAAQLRADPDRYVGRILEWRLQLIAVQRADELRSEMAQGQPYLLTRGPLPDLGFVYVTVSPEEADRFRALPSLEELVLRVRVKAARSRFLETPVVELVSVVSGPSGQ